MVTLSFHICRNKVCFPYVIVIIGIAMSRS